MEIDRRTALAIGAAAVGAAVLPAGRLSAQASAAALTPEMFGARGDGRTNDTDAFEAMSNRLMQQGGGIVELRRGATYIVGSQRPRQADENAYGYVPKPIIAAVGCPRGVTIRGNGARLRAAAGLRFGSFDPVTGDALATTMPFVDPRFAAVPYLAMIQIADCGGPVSISDVELDGNLPRLSRGGGYGDTGIQIPGSGILLVNNRADEIVRNVWTHHHPLDGMMIDGVDDPRPARRIENVRSEYNARQGCSVIGGRGYAFSNCRFAHTGRAGFYSAPGAGLDIEAEDGTIRDLRFADCEFVDNVGCGMVADTGDSAGAEFLRCTFVGTSGASAWPSKPNFSFRNCTFVGSVVRNYGQGDPDPSRATQYFDCTFTDDPARSPTGIVYLPDGASGTICDVALGANTTFQRCTFRCVAGAMMPWSWRAIYVDCVMSQRSTTVAYPKGRYLGRSTITGPVDLYGTIVDGILVVNGETISSGYRSGGAPSDEEWPPPRLQR